MLFTSLASSLGAVEELAVRRSRRLLQISIATFVGLACAAAFAKGTTQLELTESLLIDDSEGVEQQLLRLAQLGVGLAIDDFGTGYSNISYLNRFRAQRLKIDKSFIMPLADENANENLVKAMLQVAASLNFRVVAEGVETLACLERLRRLGCNEGQGYYWSPAMPLEAWLDYLAASRTQIAPE